jgi:GT2 family glycosyltransferase
MNISLIIGLKNNLDYNKNFYKTTRTLYPDVEICFASYGSTDGTHEWLDSLNDNNVKYFYSKEDKTFSDTFNKAASLATKDYIVFLHNDIVLTPRFIENIEKYLSPDTVVSYTTIEPPIFAGHERPGKIIYDLGVDLETFNIIKLNQFVEEKQVEFKDKTEPGITFFMCMPRVKYLEIGGLDSLFNPMFCEDDDLILRWSLLGMKMVTSLDAICYHFVSKTSRFSDEYKTITQQIEQMSNRNFVRKWGFRNSKYNKKYNIGFIVYKCNLQLLSILEPWCSNIYIEDEMEVIKASYYETEHKNTKFNLLDKIQDVKWGKPKNDIIIEFDATLLNQDAFQLLTQISDVITESGGIGKFELDIFKITINNLNTYEKDLIYIYDK